jgi:hypothetical protein
MDGDWASAQPTLHEMPRSRPLYSEIMTATETMGLLDQAHRHLAPRLDAAGFELVEWDRFADQRLAWVEYRHRQNEAIHLLSLTTAPDGTLLAEFWCASAGGRALEVLGQAEWRDEPISSVVGELERWLERFTTQRLKSS